MAEHISLHREVTKFFLGSEGCITKDSALLQLNRVVMSIDNFGKETTVFDKIYVPTCPDVTVCIGEWIGLNYVGG